MGWRIGQGIGPRVTWKQRKLQDLQASLGSKVSADDIKIPEDDVEASKHMYAPRDTPILIVDRKDNSHGLGYRPGMSLNETLGVKGHSNTKGPKLAGMYTFPVSYPLISLFPSWIRLGCIK
jgi:G patch domain-containing protein 1